MPGLCPRTSSVCGRKGSAVAVWPQDPSTAGGGLLECQQGAASSDLELSGVGDQFTATFGRRLSWLVWNDGTLEDNSGTCGY
jgi:hypothetical protein